MRAMRDEKKIAEKVETFAKKFKLTEFNLKEPEPRRSVPKAK